MIWKFLYHCIRIFLYSLAKPLFRFRALGTEHIPSSGSAILASNHASYLDPLFIGVGATRRINYLAKKELFYNRLFRFVLRVICGAFPVDRDQLDRHTLREIYHLLNNNEILLVFPEGTRTYDGKLGEAKLGVGLIAYNTKVPVIPVYVKGSYEILSRHSRRVYLNSCVVMFGPPVTLSDSYLKHKSKDTYKEIGRRIMESIKELEDNAPCGKLR